MNAKGREKLVTYTTNLTAQSSGDKQAERGERSSYPFFFHRGPIAGIAITRKR
ncbi:hypothetical protein H6S82_23145 [Planktothrix sp. FACHB-1355]|uniref:Uncharacterized protein n=1 Tax=Aerosakkonema funiforme FACHB-1375 TaxID=2949571 RepID=A0A926VAQ7_9CYAN|nr:MULTISPECIES: hypothetical protein [Oscillatoriales]MBD2180406.1 hypothetical protein [Aerosakkonema funiforme FACHB-1375]MBD3561717.1 hypothetical protein [Planktothrix sp. FACHB-1355]